MAVELFLCSTNYADVATLGHFVTTTGGELHYYQHFQVRDRGKWISIPDFSANFFLYTLSIFSCAVLVNPSPLSPSLPRSLPPYLPLLPPSLPPSLPSSTFPPLSQTTRDGDRLLEDLKHSLMRNTGFDGVMRVRASTGTLEKLICTSFYTCTFACLVCLTSLA